MEEFAQDKEGPTQEYQKPPAHADFVWQPTPPNGRMVDLKTGDFVTAQSAGREHQKYLFVIRNQAGLPARVFIAQLNEGDSQVRPTFPVRVFGSRKPASSQRADLSWDRTSIERLTSFLAVWPALNEKHTSNFVVIDEPAKPGERI
jgi:hypothetical protein